MFPFSKVRPIQQDFVNDVREACATRRHLIAHAPTGLGKTAATLAPALEYAIDNGKTVFFLTPKHSQHQIAVETLRLMKEKGANFTAADIIGKKWLCSQPAVDEMTNSEFNYFCKVLVRDERCAYYNSTRTTSHTLKQKAMEVLTSYKQHQPMHAEDAKDMADHSFCAYEILMELAKQSNVIIADYFHIFSPLRKALLSRVGKQLEDSIIIVDEAHNLPERVRDLMTKKISTFSLQLAEREAQTFGYYELRNEIITLRNIIELLAKGMQREKFVEKDAFLGLIENKIYGVSEFLEDLEQAGDTVLEQKKKSALSNTARFIDSWTGDDIGYARILSASLREGKPFFTLSYSCLDPTLITKDIVEQSHSTILMSGTLSPMEMYRDVLGFPKERTLLRSYRSPFPRENRLNIFVRGVTTRYSQRSDESYDKIASYVRKCIESIPGNVAIFFPSYQMRNTIFQLMRNVKKEVILEEQGATKKERKRVYDRFIALADRGAVLLGVQAGSFSEGVDLPGKYLNGVVIVGIPLDMPNLESKSLVDYYDYKFKRGWDYGYIYPAMIRSIQAAGRCIRSETDRGVCIFLDERFLWANYRKVFPPELQITVSDKPEEEIKKFFEKSQ